MPPFCISRISCKKRWHKVNDTHRRKTAFLGRAEMHPVWLSLPRAFAGPSHTGPAGEAPAVVTEAQGWRLHLSSRSSTGYAGVRKQEQASGSRGCRLPWASGRFAAYHTVDGRRVYIGSSTRRWRRRWHARAEGSVDGQIAAPPPGARCARLGHHLTMEPGPGSHDCT